MLSMNSLRRWTASQDPAGLTWECQMLMNKLHNTNVHAPVKSELLQTNESIESERESALFIQPTRVFAWVLAVFGQRPLHCLKALPILAWYEWRLVGMTWINHPAPGVNMSQQEIMWMSLHVYVKWMRDEMRVQRAKGGFCCSATDAACLKDDAVKESALLSWAFLKSI